MGSGGKGGGGEAAAARRDEQERQARIRQGTSRINSIFDGEGQGVNPLGTNATYDPKATYYNADGSAWSPEALGDTVAKQGGVQIRHKGLDPKAQFMQALSGGKLFGGVQRSGGFDDNFFSGQRQNFIDYATPQLEDQYGDASKQLTYALSRSGLLNSSVRAEKEADLQKRYDLNKQQIADQALSYETQARNNVEDARSNLIATLNATGDAQGAANSAIARASALSQPAAYSPISNLFADFTAGLGTQAALEKANYYSGGQTGVRYNTGLFGPNNKSVKVTS